MEISQPLRQPFERLIRAMSKYLPEALAGEVEPLHQVRVTTRRLREILPLCACEIPRDLANRSRRRVRRVGRLLGRVREIDVSIEVVRELIKTEFVGRFSGQRLEQCLLDEREECRERMLDRLSSVNTRKLERDLADIAKVLGMRQETDIWARMLAVRIERRSEDLCQAVVEAGALYISDRVHCVRIAAKKLRYALELSQDTGEVRIRSSVRELKGVQKLLGDLHDLEVLGTIIQDLTMPSADGIGDSTNNELEALRLALDGKCRELHGQYVARRDSLLQLCQSTVKVAARIWIDRGGEALAKDTKCENGRVLRMTIPVVKQVNLTNVDRS